MTLREVILGLRWPPTHANDIGFLDAGTSKIESRTKFSFKVKRDLGFDAGEYKVTVRDTRDGKIVGTATNITFDGENEVIDRRSIVFQGGDSKKKKKKDEAKAEGDGDKEEGGEKKEEGGGEKAEDESKSEGSSDEGSSSEGGDEGPPPIEEKPGGCGCRIPGTPHGSSLSLLAALALAGVVVARRRLT